MSVLQSKGFVVGGFVALHEIESDSYQIKDSRTQKQAPLMQRVATFDERPNHFKFFPKGIEMGNNCIQDLLIHHPHIAVIDEIGGYELRGKLWSDSFTQLVASSVPLIFTVKERLLFKVVEKWNIKPTLIISPLSFINVDETVERMKRFL